MTAPPPPTFAMLAKVISGTRSMRLMYNMMGAHQVTQNAQKKVTMAAPTRIDVWWSLTQRRVSSLLSSGLGGGTMCIRTPKPTMVASTSTSPVQMNARIRPASSSKSFSQLPRCGPSVWVLNPGQAKKLAAALGDRATLRAFTVKESAGAHSHPGAGMLLNGVVFDWLADALDVADVSGRLPQAGNAL